MMNFHYSLVPFITSKMKEIPLDHPFYLFSSFMKKQFVVLLKKGKRTKIIENELCSFRKFKDLFLQFWVQFELQNKRYRNLNGLAIRWAELNHRVSSVCATYCAN